MAHIRENGRVTLMFCAFEGPALILRLYGRGQRDAVRRPGFEERKAKLFPSVGRARNIVTVEVERIADSCGWGVPVYDFREQRDQLMRAIEHPAIEDLNAKRYASNAQSIDGLPGLERPEPAE